MAAANRCAANYRRGRRGASSSSRALNFFSTRRLTSPPSLFTLPRDVFESFDFFTPGAPQRRPLSPRRRTGREAAERGPCSVHLFRWRLFFLCLERRRAINTRVKGERCPSLDLFALPSALGRQSDVSSFFFFFFFFSFSFFLSVAVCGRQERRSLRRPAGRRGPHALRRPPVRRNAPLDFHRRRSARPRWSGGAHVAARSFAFAGHCARAGRRRAALRRLLCPISAPRSIRPACGNRCTR